MESLWCRIIVALLAGMVSFSFGLDGNESCLRRFEYEYHVLEKLIVLEQAKAEMAGKIETLTAKLQAKTQALKDLSQRVSTLTGNVSAGGSVYIRWGRTTCPTDTGAELVYDGYVGGGYYTHAGSGTNYLCLPKDPIFGEDITGGYRAKLYGAEYQTSGTVWASVYNHDVPCAVCRSSAPSVLMIPGRNECQINWRLEYQGYLMTGYYTHAGAKNFVCVDGEPETVNSGSSNSEGALLYLVEGKCGSLKCPPYINNQELTCAVCSYAV